MLKYNFFPHKKLIPQKMKNLCLDTEIVGEGTYGIVMKCLNKSTGLPVAVKKLRNTIHSHSYYCNMIMREINLLKMLSHEHVVLMIEAFRDHGYIYMVFPFMLCNLYKHLEQNGGVLTVDCTKKCMYQVLRGLNYVHGQNIVHHDIKPENILISTTGIVKICDFGVSRMFSMDGLLELSAEIGTIWYQAPEILMKSKNYDTTVDIWSVGVLFTELVNQFPLVTEQTVVDQLYGIAKILNCNSIELTVINKYLRKHGVSLNVEPQQGPLSKSYTFSNTALALQKVYAEWPIHLLQIVTHCLQLNPKNRRNAAQLLDMDFFTFGTFILEFSKELENKLKCDQNHTKHK